MQTRDYYEYHGKGLHDFLEQVMTESRPGSGRWVFCPFVLSADLLRQHSGSVAAKTIRHFPSLARILSRRKLEDDLVEIGLRCY